jgi:hypothetical protein
LSRAASTRRSSSASHADSQLPSGGPSTLAMSSATQAPTARPRGGRWPLREASWPRQSSTRL